MRSLRKRGGNGCAALGTLASFQQWWPSPAFKLEPPRDYHGRRLIHLVLSPLKLLPRSLLKIKAFLSQSIRFSAPVFHQLSTGINVLQEELHKQVRVTCSSTALSSPLNNNRCPTTYQVASRHEDLLRQATGIQRLEGMTNTFVFLYFFLSLPGFSSTPDLLTSSNLLGYPRNQMCCR